MDSLSNRNVRLNKNYKMCINISRLDYKNTKDMITKENYVNWYFTKGNVEVNSILSNNDSIKATASTTVFLPYITINALPFDEWLAKYYPTGIDVKILEDIVHDKTSYGYDYHIEECKIHKLINENN